MYYYQPPPKRGGGWCACCLVPIILFLAVILLAAGCWLLAPAWTTDLAHGTPRPPRPEDLNPTAVANAEILAERGIWVGQQNIPPELAQWLKQLQGGGGMKLPQQQRPPGVPKLDWSRVSQTQAPLELAYGSGMTTEERSWMDKASKIVFDIFGYPWPVEGRRVQVTARKPNSQEEQLGIGAFYDTDTDAITILRYDQPFTDQYVTECHELVHAYLVFGPEGEETLWEWVEGLAEFGGWVCGDTFGYTRGEIGHALHETLNVPLIIPPTRVMWRSPVGKLIGARYAAAGQGWLDVWSHDQTFFKRFGQEMASQYPRPDDPGITEESVWEVARQVQPKIDSWLEDDLIMRGAEPNSNLDNQTHLFWVWVGVKREFWPEGFEQDAPPDLNAVFFWQAFYFQRTATEEIPLEGRGSISLDGAPANNDLEFSYGNSAGMILDPQNFQSLEIEIGGHRLKATKSNLFKWLEEQKPYEPPRR